MSSMPRPLCASRNPKPQGRPQASLGLDKAELTPDTAFCRRS